MSRTITLPVEELQGLLGALHDALATTALAAATIDRLMATDPTPGVELERNRTDRQCVVSLADRRRTASSA